MSSRSPDIQDANDSEARRAFLARCGRFAVVTPPMITMLLSVSSVPNEANASTIGHKDKKPKKIKTGGGRDD